MSTEARVIVQFEQSGELRIVDAVLPDPAPTEVLVRMVATGLCQSQIWWMHQPRKTPLLFGHEGYGFAAKVGSQVTDIREGDPVLVTWLPRQDPGGRPAQVATLKLPDGQVARAPNSFTWADHTLVDSLYVKPIRHTKHDALMSVIACAVITGAGSVLNTAKAKKGETIAVYGVGGVGLSAVVAAKVVGAERIIAVDLDDEKLKFAQQFGATDTVNSRRDDPVRRIHELLPGKCGCCSGVDIALDVVALPETTLQAYGSLRNGRVGIERGGHCVVVGVPKKSVEISTFDLVFTEKTLSGAFAGSCRQEQIDDFIDWYHDGLLDLDTLVTNRYAFEQIPQAANALMKGEVLGRAIAYC